MTAGETAGHGREDMSAARIVLTDHTSGTR
jgi:hypothetical protein